LILDNLGSGFLIGLRCWTTCAALLELLELLSLSHSRFDTHTHTHTRARDRKGRMDILLENLPQLVPDKKKVDDWFDLEDGALDVWKDVEGGGTLFCFVLVYLTGFGGWC
jgi:hypothetical protein